MIQIRFEKDKQRAAAYDGDALVGFCEVQVVDGEWTIPHTEVDSAYGGQGIARKLVLCAAEQAERVGVKVIPVCPYAKQVLE